MTAPRLSNEDDLDSLREVYGEDKALDGNATSAACVLDRILQLAATERKLRDSPQWKNNIEGAFEAHGEAVEHLYSELYHLLDARTASGNPVPQIEPKVDPRKEIRRQLVAHLKREIPRMVEEAINDF